MTAALPVEAERAVENIRHADLVVGIPTFNNATTIAGVVSAVQAGLSKYFPQLRAIVVTSDGGSSDGVRQQILSVQAAADVFLLETPLPGPHRIAMPYHGVPGKASAYRMIFEMARRLRAKACIVVDSDLQSITPEWVDLLVRPILVAGYDFVAPAYHRHKHDGAITNSIVYPLNRALYGKRLRQPVCAEFGVSAALMERYLDLSDWETDTARDGSDVWLATVAVAEGFRVCQSTLGPRRRAGGKAMSDLSSVLEQIVGSVFSLAETYEDVWQSVRGSLPVDAFGRPPEWGLDPIPTDAPRMIAQFHAGCRELEEILRLALDGETFSELHALAVSARRGQGTFAFPDLLWTRVLMDFACAFHHRRLRRGVLLRSLTPLYLGRAASFIQETEDMITADVEDRLEKLCLEMEAYKPRFASCWRGESARGEQS